MVPGAHNQVLVDRQTLGVGNCPQHHECVLPVRGLALSHSSMWEGGPGMYPDTNVFCLFSVPQSDGTLLATGSYDGFARIWTEDGKFCIPRVLSKIDFMCDPE